MFDWGVVRVNLELVYCYIRIDSSHVLMRPSKAVMMLFEKLNESEAEVEPKSHANLDLMI